MPGYGFFCFPPARLREIQDTSSTIKRRGGSTGRAGLFDGKGCAINSNMAHCPAKVYIFFNKNSNIAVVIFYNDFKSLHAIMALISKFGKETSL